MTDCVIAVDQGTTSTRSIVFDDKLKPIITKQRVFDQYYPSSGWVEHNPFDLYNTTLETMREAIRCSGVSPNKISAIGITNQRETIVIWDKFSGEPIYNAIVWQDRRTAEYCRTLEANQYETEIQQAAGLLVDPYFCASKIRWILDNVEGANEKARNGQLLFGTVDTWLIWNLSGGRSHVTDATNASRTQLYNIHEGNWDENMLALFDIPESMLPEVLDCAAEFALTDPKLIGVAIPIRSVAGDQHAALIGQACFNPGMMKSTYGTGCFAILNTGGEAVKSNHRLLTTIGYQLNGKTTYALEGSIFVAGAAVQWLRDSMKLISNASDSDQLAINADSKHHVYLVPAFVGLGAPHWDAEARGAIYGLTRNSGPSEFARAVLESVGYQTSDLLQAMRKDWHGSSETVLRVDGGMTASDWCMQFLADILNCPVDRPRYLETTALGAAYLAGLQCGLYPQPDDFAKSWERDKTFEPGMDTVVRDKLYSGWQDALARTLNAK